METRNLFQEIVFAVALVFVPGMAPVFGQNYVWPLEESKSLTAGFCDHRTAHFHGGVDISTGGAEGLKVRAADSGSVYRLSTSYWGMGKALYLKLADGRIAVYGHLAHFADPIRRYLEQQQYSLKRYNTNLFPLPDELPVRRGEVVGYTGQTGSGPPHLHFEIRTAGNFPLDPLAAGTGFTDRLAPEFKGVLIRPLLTIDPDAAVEDGCAPVYITAKKTATPGHYVARKASTVSGVVGLAVQSADPTGYKTNAIAPHHLMVKVNGQQWFEITIDSLDYDVTRQVDLAYDFAWQAATGEDLIALYRHPANALSWYHSSPGDGILDPARPGTPFISGENRIEISAFDAAGNVATLEMTLVLNRSPQAREVQLVESGGQWRLTGKVSDPDDHVTRLRLYRNVSKSAGWEEVWERSDSIAGDRLDYLIAGRFSPRERLRLEVTDSRGAKTTVPLQAPGELSSELKPKEIVEIMLVGRFVPGGLILQPISSGQSPTPADAALTVRAADSLPWTRGRFLGVPHLLAAADHGMVDELVWRADGGGIATLTEAEKNRWPGDILSWPKELMAVGTGGEKAMLSADSLARVQFKPGDLYDDGFFRIRVYTCPRDLKPQPASKIYSFEPTSVPFARKVKVGISYAGLPEHADDLALYGLSADRKSWAYLARDVDSGEKTMSAPVWSFGSYALVADTLPPVISSVVPARDAKVSDPLPEITFSLADNLSGIGSDTDITILLDGEWVIPEYDPETSKVKTRPRTPLVLGKHKLEITARDRVGHEDTFLRNFTVVKKSQ